MSEGNHQAKFLLFTFMENAYNNFIQKFFNHELSLTWNYGTMNLNIFQLTTTNFGQTLKRKKIHI